MKNIVIDGIIFGLQRAGGISRIWAETLVGLDSSFAMHHRVFVLIPKNSNVEWQAIASKLKNIRVVKRRRFRWARRGLLRESIYLSYLALRLRPHLWHSTYYVGFPFVFSGHKVITFHDMIHEVMGTGNRYETTMKYQSIKKKVIV